MPELPEVECIRRSLSKSVLGKKFSAVELLRRDVVVGRADAASLLVGQRLATVMRRGKRLVLVGSGGGVVELQLGMTGSLSVGSQRAKHDHVVWFLDRTQRLAFNDPRRFGRVRTWGCLDALFRSWSKLGVDALDSSAIVVAAAIPLSVRSVKVVLLDQTRIAGVGNIYADEILHSAGVSPRRRARSLTDSERLCIAKCVRPILSRAIRSGGSTIKSYRHPDGSSGLAQVHHRVYGRGGKPCLACGKKLTTSRIGGRITVYCRYCQT